MKRYIALMLVISVIFIMPNMTFAENEDESLDSLNVFLGEWPSSFDPASNWNETGADIINNLFEGLMRYDNGMLQPAVAESYDVSEDKLVYTFHIRRGALWSDDEQISAEDFVYAWNRAQSDQVDNNYAWIFEEAKIKSYKAIDSLTLQVELSEPTPYFIELMAFFSFFPVRQDAVDLLTVDQSDWNMAHVALVTNGPFTIESYVKFEDVLLVKNDRYWDADSVKLKSVHFDFSDDEWGSLGKYVCGDIDILDLLPAMSAIKYLEPKETIVSEPINGIYYYVLNQAVEPLDDRRVRKALSLAVDRTRLVERLSDIQPIPHNSIVSLNIKNLNGNHFSDTAHSYIPLDGSGIEEAKALLAEAGYPNGEGFPNLEILYNESSAHESIAKGIQQMWKENLNIDIVLREIEWADYMGERKKGVFEIARCGWLGDYPDPVTYLSMFATGSPQNYSNWSSAEYDELIENSMQVDGIEREQILYDALDTLMNESICLPLYNYSSNFIVSESVVGWQKDPFNQWYFGKTERQLIQDERQIQKADFKAPEQVGLITEDRWSESELYCHWKNTGADSYMIKYSEDGETWLYQHSYMNICRVDTFDVASDVMVSVASVVEGKVSDFSDPVRLSDN